MAIAQLLDESLKGGLPVRLRAYDGSEAGPPDASATVILRSPDALARILTRPGELGLGRAYVAGDLDLEGDIYSLFALNVDANKLRIAPHRALEILRAVGRPAIRFLPPPPEEARVRGAIHSRRRDHNAVSHHYDVGNAFYELVLGTSMTYSCAVFGSPHDPLETAQANKYDLVCAKLGLEPGMRLLDVGCGWGGMVRHAATHYGVDAVGVTVSERQYEWATKRVADEGLGGRVEIRLQDYREVADGPFDAISSIGMFEHVGRARMEEYVSDLCSLLAPGGRLLNHAIAQPGHPFPATPTGRVRAASRRMAVAAGLRAPSKIHSPFMDRYVFPDGELHEVGVVVSMLQDNGFEVRHLESLREHYALTLRQWVANLDRNWDEAVRQVGAGRARVWRFYMAGSAVGFERHNLEIHQVLAVRPDAGRSGMPLRPDFEGAARSPDVPRSQPR